MILYELFNGEESETFTTLAAAKKRAREIRDYNVEEQLTGCNASVDVDKITCPKLTRALFISAVNGNGYVVARETVYTARGRGSRKSEFI